MALTAKTTSRNHFLSCREERDTETGLDFAQARYYSNVQGRFTSVDPENAGASEEDPQNWNGYAFVRNNPLLYTDPDGRKFKICSPDGKECHEHSDKDFNDLKASAGKNGHTIKDGKIFSGDQLIGTYQKTSFDDLSAFSNGVLFETARYAPALNKFATGGAIVSGGLIMLPAIGLAGGSGFTTLGLTPSLVGEVNTVLAGYGLVGTGQLINGTLTLRIAGVAGQFVTNGIRHGNGIVALGRSLIAAAAGGGAKKKLRYCSTRWITP